MAWTPPAPGARSRLPRRRLLLLATGQRSFGFSCVCPFLWQAVRCERACSRRVCGRSRPLARLCAQPAQQAISSFCALCSPTRRRLLTAGPRDPRARVQRWSQHNRLIRGEDLGDAIVDPKEWPVDIDQRPLFLRYGPSGDMIPNPLWEPTAPEQGWSTS